MKFGGKIPYFLNQALDKFLDFRCSGYTLRIQIVLKLLFWYALIMSTKWKLLKFLSFEKWIKSYETNTERIIIFWKNKSKKWFILGKNYLNYSLLFLDILYSYKIMFIQRFMSNWSSNNQKCLWKIGNK